jgi:hypothetical protein
VTAHDIEPEIIETKTGPGLGALPPAPATAAARAGDEPHPQRFVVMGVVSIALLMASMDQTIVSTALGSLQRDLHASINWTSWTITIYALAQILVSTPPLDRDHAIVRGRASKIA